MVGLCSLSEDDFFSVHFSCGPNLRAQEYLVAVISNTS